MTLKEMQKLRRGDVVQYAHDGYICIGLVSSHVGGVWITWEDGDRSGPYRTTNDAKKLTLFSRGPRQ